MMLLDLEQFEEKIFSIDFDWMKSCYQKLPHESLRMKVILSAILIDDDDKNYLEWEPIVKKYADSQVKEGKELTKQLQLFRLMKSQNLPPKLCLEWLERKQEQSWKETFGSLFDIGFYCLKRSYPAVEW